VLKSCENKRRWLGVLFLAIAAGLLIWGQTVFLGHLAGWAGTAYHSICLLFTFMAVLAGLSDFWRIRRRMRSRRRDLARRMLDAARQAAGSHAVISAGTSAENPG
jgi:hypothetical protein